jgi:signal peptidase I
VIPKDPDEGQGQSSGEDQTDWEVSLFDFEDVSALLSTDTPILNISVEAIPSDSESAPPKEKDSEKKSIPFWIEMPILIGIALIVAVVIKTFFFQAFFIPSGSMKDTLQINDRVFVNKISYAVGDIARGDVIVFDDPRSGFETPSESVVSSAVRNLFESIGLATPKSEFIKRVIGLPGDEVELVDNQLFVNGVAFDEPYLEAEARPPSTCGDSGYGPEVVPEGHLLVMGDNRCHSSDGRSFGPIPEEDIVGKAFVIIWPPSRWSGL